MGVFSFQRGSRTAPTTHEALPISGTGASPVANKRRWTNFMPFVVFLVVVAEISFLGKLDLANKATFVDSWTELFSPSSAVVGGEDLGLVGDDLGLLSCEGWLEREDAVAYSRNFDKDPVLVSGDEKDWKSCSVGCQFGGDSGRKPDASFGLAHQEGTSSVLRSMESAQYYAENNIDYARRAALWACKMVGRGEGYGRGVSEDQQTEMAEMRRMIEDLTRAFRALQGQGRRGARMEIPEGGPDTSGVESEGHSEDEKDVDNPFHDAAGDGDCPNRGRLEEELVCTLDLSDGGIETDVSDFFGWMHGEDYNDDLSILEPIYDDYDDDDEVHVQTKENLEESLYHNDLDFSCLDGENESMFQHKVLACAWSSPSPSDGLAEKQGKDDDHFFICEDTSVEFEAKVGFSYASHYSIPFQPHDPHWENFMGAYINTGLNSKSELLRVLKLDAISKRFYGSQKFLEGIALCALYAKMLFVNLIKETKKSMKIGWRRYELYDLFDFNFTNSWSSSSQPRGYDAGASKSPILI